MRKSHDTKAIRSRKALHDSVIVSYQCRRNIAVGPTTIQAAFLKALGR